MANCTKIHPLFDEIENDLSKVRLKMNMRFNDQDGDDCQYIAIAGWRDTEDVEVKIGDSIVGTVLRMKFHPISHIYTWTYKGEIYITSFEKTKEGEPEVYNILMNALKKQFDTKINEPEYW